MIRRQPPAGARRQRGAILIMTAAFIVAAVALLALAIDTGRLYAAQAKLQSVTNLAALNAARVAGGCKAGIGGSKNNKNAIVSAVNTAVTNTIEANSDNGSGITQLDNSPALGNTVTHSALRHFTADFTDVDPREADTVRVQLTREAPTPLFELFGEPQQLEATAAATQTPMAGLSIGSRLANVSTAQSALLNAVLGQMLGTALDLTAASYEGLAGSYVSLLDLVDANANIATAQDLLSTTLSTGELLDQIGKIAGVPNIGSGASGEIKLGDLLQVEPDADGVAANVPINALGLISALAQTSASQRNAVVKVGSGLLDGLLGTLSMLPGVDIALKLELGVIEPPQYSSVGRPGYDDPNAGQYTNATGSTNALSTHDGLGARTWASTSSVNLDLDAHVTLNLLLVNLSLDLPLYLHIGKAYALLDSIQCPTAEQRMRSVDVAAQPGILEAGIGHFDNIFDPNPEIGTGGQLLGLRVLGLNIVGLPLPSDNFVAGADSDEQRLFFDGPFVSQINQPSTDNTRTVDSKAGDSIGNLLGDVVDHVNDYVIEEDPFTGIGGVVLNAVTSLLRRLGLDSLLDVVGNLLNSLLSALDFVLDPLLDLLGVSLGSADITIQKVITDQPTLICTSQSDCESFSEE